MGLRSFLRFLVLIGLGGALACGAAAEQIGSVSQKLYVKRATLWPATGPVTRIPVCWESMDANDADARGWVRQGAHIWEEAGAIQFTGWFQCRADSKGIHIAVRDENPHTTDLGNELDGKAGGMVLDFRFKLWTGNTANTPYCELPANRQFCVTVIAAHEFGHALGAAHEQNRSDRVKCDIAPQGEDGDWTVTPYDRESIMNYCASNWNGNGHLSELDRIAISVLYGKGSFAVGGRNAAVAFYNYPQSQQLETLFVSDRGQLGLTWKANNGVWRGPVFLTKPDFLPRGAHIALASYPMNRQLEALYAGNDGAIYVQFKANNQLWSDPIRLTAPGVAQPGGHIALAYYPPYNQFEAVFIGKNGGVNLIWKANNGAWQGPVTISPSNIAPPGGGVALAYYPLNRQFEGMFADNNGVMNIFWKANNSAWHTPVGISTPHLAKPGGQVTMTYYPLNQQLEAFIVDAAGTVDVLWKANNGAWQGPATLSPHWFAPPGGPIRSVYQPLNQQLEVFTVGGNRSLQMVWKANNGAWAQPVTLAPAGSLDLDADIGGAFQPLNNQLELFYTDRGGNLGFVWKANNGPWVQARRF